MLKCLFKETNKTIKDKTIQQKLKNSIKSNKIFNKHMPNSKNKYKLNWFSSVKDLRIAST